MKSFLNLIVALTVSLFIAGPAMAQERVGQDNTNNSIFDLQINENNTSTSQTVDSGEGNDLNTNLTGTILGQGNLVSNTSVQVYGSGSAIGKSNVTVSEINQIGNNNFAAIALVNQ
ncbi:MAG TPA: hypothetical protein ACFYD3_06410 [Candidatus Hypogeohydataceae bacterium YC41]